MSISRHREAGLLGVSGFMLLSLHELSLTAREERCANIWMWMYVFCDEWFTQQLLEIVNNNEVIVKLIVYPKMKKLFYSPSFHPSCRWVCFFMTDLEKVSITPIVHQWILCGEWVPSGMRVQTADKHHKRSTIDWHFGKKQWLWKCPNDLFITCGLLVDYCGVLLLKLQRMHWWARDVLYISPNLFWLTDKLLYITVQLQHTARFQLIFIFGKTIP